MKTLNFRAAIKGDFVHAMTVCGCTKRELRLHIQAQLKPGMYWWNYGFEWEVDHITPTSFFEDNAEGQRACHHFSNLQPLWIKDNIRKGNKMGVEKVPSRAHPIVKEREIKQHDFFERMAAKWGRGWKRLQSMTVFACGDWAMEEMGK